MSFLHIFSCDWEVSREYYGRAIKRNVMGRKVNEFDVWKKFLICRECGRKQGWYVDEFDNIVEFG